MVDRLSPAPSLTPFGGTYISMCPLGGYPAREGRTGTEERKVRHMPRPVHFEFSADDPEKLAKFYEETLGWRAQKWDGPTDYWLFMTGEEGQPGIDGGLMKRDEHTPAGTVNTVDVPNLDEYIDKVVAAGGKVVAPRITVPGVGYMCSVMDPEGNVFGLMESDANAK